MLNNVKFITSSSSSINWIDDDKKEIVILGKSNVGKSTFINRLSNNSNLAKTSSTPGRTRLLNFFDVDNRYRLVDAPGYGYNKGGISVDASFATLMDEYFNKRMNLKGAILLIDSRRIPDEDDRLMLDMILEHNLQLILVATKVDKLNQSERYHVLENFKKGLNISNNINIIYSQFNKDKWIDKVNDSIEFIIK